MKRPFAAYLIALAVPAMLAACLAAALGPNQGYRADSWTVVVSVTDSDHTPLEGVWIDVRSEHVSVPYALATTDAHGLAFVRVRGGDVIFLPEYSDPPGYRGWFEWEVGAPVKASCRFIVVEATE